MRLVPLACAVFVVVAALPAAAQVASLCLRGASPRAVPVAVEELAR